MKKKVRVVVADEGSARFYDLISLQEPLQPFDDLVDHRAHLHDRDFKSDRPGRVFDHAAAAGARRGSVGHHATGGDRRPRQHEAEQFARRIIDALEAGRRAGGFQALVLMAGPPFLGVLRAAMPAALRAVVTAEVHKDLVHEGEQAVRAHLPPDAFPLG
ncbi:MAG TPA: host attachment protein [Steroidobacteraceae bacterium]|nr:host attachment protein [Steroidobacteraceae bacterium]